MYSCLYSSSFFELNICHSITTTNLRAFPKGLPHVRYTPVTGIHAVTLWSRDLFIRMPYQLRGEYTALLPSSCWNYSNIYTEAFPVLPDTHLLLSRDSTCVGIVPCLGERSLSTAEPSQPLEPAVSHLQVAHVTTEPQPPTTRLAEYQSSVIVVRLLNFKWSSVVLRGRGLSKNNDNELHVLNNAADLSDDQRLPGDNCSMDKPGQVCCVRVSTCLRCLFFKPNYFTVYQRGSGYSGRPRTN